MSRLTGVVIAALLCINIFSFIYFSQRQMQQQQEIQTLQGEKVKMKGIISRETTIVARMRDYSRSLRKRCIENNQTFANTGNSQEVQWIDADVWSQMLDIQIDALDNSLAP